MIPSNSLDYYEEGKEPDILIIDEEKNNKVSLDNIILFFKFT